MDRDGSKAPVLTSGKRFGGLSLLNPLGEGSSVSGLEIG